MQTLNGSSKARYHFEEVTYYAIVCRLEKGRFRVFIDNNNHFAPVDTGKVLNSTRDTQCEIQVGSYLNTGLTHVLMMWSPMSITHRTTTGSSGFQGFREVE
jgi:hypothetical protein